MLNRCEICDDICPEGARLCNTCLYIEEQEGKSEEIEDDEDKF